MLWAWKGAEKRADPERRSNDRLDKVFPVWLDGDRGGAHGVARNISPGGLFVETPVPQPIGTQVRITFSSGGGEMSAIAEVRYVCALTGRAATAHQARGPVGVRGMGLRFLYFEGEDEAVRPEPLH